MSRYVPARHYISFGAAALALAGCSGWFGFSTWTPAFVPAAVFLIIAAVMLALAFRPEIKVFDDHLEIGKRLIPWQDVRRVDRTGWVSPLVVRLTLYDEETVVVIYPGEVDCCKHLLRTIRQMATSAVIDNVPYRQYWGELLGSPLHEGSDARQLTAPRYRVLRPEDEEEVERLYFLLKTVGHIDPRNSGDER
jgi:hypothetical protein